MFLPPRIISRPRGLVGVSIFNFPEVQFQECLIDGRLHCCRQRQNHKADVQCSKICRKNLRPSKATSKENNKQEQNGYTLANRRRHSSHPHLPSSPPFQTPSPAAVATLPSAISCRCFPIADFSSIIR
ncbi:unnamed protein product [Lactuca virosa]|uniref:Uncharacterized protein n=1 Tax=Lactuca virosa TaxID=75947 RepID=A0AAU9N6R2_9ASTR|nr:unnamed protein product [Lactuca virosa]